MFAQKIKAKIGDNRTLVLHLPEISPGEVEIIILGETERPSGSKDLSAMLPVHRLGHIQGMLRREDIYSDAR